MPYRLSFNYSHLKEEDQSRSSLAVDTLPPKSLNGRSSPTIIEVDGVEFEVAKESEKNNSLAQFQANRWIAKINK